MLIIKGSGKPRQKAIRAAQAYPALCVRSTKFFETLSTSLRDCGFQCREAILAPVRDPPFD